jgi:hypothetical protein
MNRSTIWVRTLSALPLVVLALDACSDAGPVAVATKQPCGSASVVALNVLQGATIDCSAGSSIELTGGGARYLVVPEFAAGDVTNRATSFVLSDSDALASPASALASASSTRAGSSSLSGARGVVGAGARQVRFDAALRSRERAASASGRWLRAASGSKGVRADASIAAQASVVPAAGSIRAFQVISSFDVQNPTYTTVNAKLEFTGANTLVYVDTLAPANGFTTTQLNSFGQGIDGTFYTIDVNEFGPPSDIDGNGRVIVLLTPVVNKLSPASKCSTEGYIAGFFDGFDLSGTLPNSNQGEIYYGLVPDPNGTLSCVHSVSTVASISAGTFMHELQHMISYSQHVIVHSGSPEDGWLDEGMSIFAQELGSLYYEQKFPPSTGRTNPNQLLPDSAEGFIADEFVEAFDYLEKPDTSSLSLHSDADGGLTWRAGDWLFLHWLGDQKGASFYRSLEQSTLTGTANIAAAGGESFQSLFGDFGLSMWTDSIPGISKASIPQRDKFTTRTLRTIFQAVFNAGGSGSAGPFPVVLRSITGQTTGSMVPGTVSYFELDTSPSVATSTLHFAPSGGGAFSSSLHPQVSIFRLQ